MYPLRRLIWGDHGCGKTAALVQSAAGLLASGCDSTEIVALSVHRPAVRGLRKALQDRLSLDIPTADVRRRATAILEQFPAAAHLPAGWTSSDIISAIDRRALMRRAWSEEAAAGSLYGRYGNAPGALDWLARVFDAFAEWSGTADPGRLAGCAPGTAPLVELWGAYRRYLLLGRQLGLVAFQEVLPRAIDALDDPRVRTVVAPRALLLDDLDLFRPAELLFARALVASGTAVIAASAAVPTAGSDDPQIRYLANWCADLGLVPHEQTGVPVLPPSFAASYVEYATPSDEVEAIARSIAATLPEGGRLADYAVVSFDPMLVAPLRRTFPEWGIAVEGMEARDAYTLALGPILLAGMRLLAGEVLPLEDFIACVIHPLLDLSPKDSHLFAIFVLNAPATSRTPSGVDLLFSEHRWPDDLSLDGRLRLRRIVEVTRRLRESSLVPSAKLRRWLAQLDLDRRAKEQTSLALEPWAAAADETLLDRWISFLERSEHVHSALGTPLRDAEAVEVLASIQALVEPIAKPLTDAVQIWQPEELGGCSTGTVWIAGLNEDVLPAKPAPLPWAESGDFTAAFGGLPGFVAPYADDRAARWQRAQSSLRRAAGRAWQSLLFSWSATDRDGRRRLPSPVLQAVLPGLAPVATAVPQSVDGLRPRGVDAMLVCSPARAEELEIAGLTTFTTSPSAVENFLQCPRQYFYARELHLYDVASSARQAFGQVVHAALRDLKLAGEEAAEIAELLERHWPKRERRFGSRLREAAYRRLAEKAVAQLVAADQERSGTNVCFVAAEASFTWQIAPDVELRGTIDRIDRGPAGLIVLDYKLSTLR